MLLGLLSVSISMSVAIAVTALSRNMLHLRWSARVLCGLWLVIAVRMLIPIQFFAPIIQQPIPVEKIQEEMFVIDEVQNHPVIQVRPSETLSELESVFKGEVAPKEELAQAVHSMTLEQMLVIVWLTGFLVTAGVRLAGYYRLKVWLHKNSKFAFEIDKIKVFYSKPLPEPMAFGTFRPSVYLPIDQKDENQWILTHELIHCKHHDGMLQVIMSLVRVIHWFNPFTMLMERLWEMDRELYCDEDVLNRKSEENHVEYMRVLMSAAENTMSKRSYFASGLLDGKTQLKQRFEQIKKWNLKGKGKVVMISLSILSLLCAGLVGCSEANSPVEEDLSSDSVAEIDNESGLYAFTFNTAKFDECAKNDLALHLLTYYGEEYVEIRESLKLGKGIYVLGKEIPAVLYPVWQDNKIIGVFNVIYYGGTYSGSYSEGNSEQLSYAIGKTSRKRPLKLLKTANGFYYAIGNDVYSMTGNPGEVVHNISINIELFQKTFLTNGKVVNIKETLEYIPIESDIEFLE